jgi:hypothetical protein
MNDLSRQRAAEADQAALMAGQAPPESTSSDISVMAGTSRAERRRRKQRVAALVDQLAAAEAREEQARCKLCRMMQRWIKLGQATRRLARRLAKEKGGCR